MRTPKVRLYIRVRRSDGRHSYAEPIWNKNHTLRTGFALIGGQPQFHPEGSYYLRFLDGDKRVWQQVGSDSDKAIVALRNREHDLQSVALGRSAADPPPQCSTDISLLDAIEAYLAEVRRFRAPKTIAGCEQMLKLFGSLCPKLTVHAVKREDLLNHMSALKGRGLGQRSIHNHIARICTLLRVHKVTGLLSASDKPKYDEKVPDAYDSDQLMALFAAANEEERILFEFFLGTGFREQEVMYCTWRDIDFRGKIITVRSKPGVGFGPKDDEERSVPVPDSLIAALASRKKTSTSMLVFPGREGKPDGHFLRTLKKLAFRCGLNCGECRSKAGKSCAKSPICSEWQLHKFRRTFATMHSEAGVSPRSIQRWLGHSDLATTLRYLSVADMRSERTRNQVNASFAALSVGGAA